MIEKVIIKNSKVEPIWFVYIEDDHLRLEFEYYADHNGGGNSEGIHKITPEKYEVIKEHFKISHLSDIGEALQQISNSVRGEEFKNWALENAIAEIEFVWVTFD